MRAVPRSLALVFAALAGFAVLSCGGDSTGTGNGVGKVVITPSNDSIDIGASVTLSAKVVNAQGQVVSGATVFWNTSNANVATVSSNGTVTGIDTGSVQIAASANGVSGIAAISVMPRPVASVTVSPPTVTLKVGGTQRLAALLFDADGNPLTGRVVTWSSSDPTVATVDNTGLVTAVAVGPATVTATSEGKSGSAAVSVGAQVASKITVAPTTVSITVGQTSQLTATVLDASGATIAGAPVAWTIDKPSVASLSSSGLGTDTVTGISVGTATITATSGAAHTTIPVTVSPSPASAVIISPGSATLFVTQQLQLSATVTDSHGNPLSGQAVTWTSNNENVATVSGTGNVSAVAPGSATITAMSGAAHGTASITVKLVPVSSVSVTPNLVSLFVGQTSQLGVVLLDSVGDTLSAVGRAVNWKSNKGGVATVSASGLVTAQGLGAAVITATVEGQQGFASVTVANVPVSSVVVTPTPDTLQLGQAIQLTAQTFDSVGNPLTGRIISWDTDNSSVAIVSSNGRVVSQGIGTANITATSEGKVGTAAVVVIAVPVASVTVSPPNKTMNVGDTATFTATTKDAQGHVLTGRVIAWSSDNTAVATVDTTGLVTAVAPGSANITATSEGQSGSSAVMVNPVPVGSVIVTPQDTTMTAGDSAQFSAQTLDSKGNPLSGRAVSWSTSDKQTATVSMSGVVQALQGGPPIMITATSEGVNGTTSLTVIPPPPPPPPGGAIATGNVAPRQPSPTAKSDLP